MADAFALSGPREELCTVLSHSAAVLRDAPPTEQGETRPTKRESVMMVLNARMLGSAATAAVPSAAARETAAVRRCMISDRACCSSKPELERERCVEGEG
jgi:hypothetical protein